MANTQMGDTSGAKHLTSLDFDLSNIWKQFEQLQAELPLRAKEIGERTSIELKNSMETSLNQLNTTALDTYTSNLINTEKFEQARKELDEIAISYGKLAQSAITYDEATKRFSGTITYDDEQGNKVIAYYKQVQDELNEEELIWKRLKTTSTENYQLQQKQRAKEITDTQTLLQQTNSLIAKQKEFGKQMEGYVPSLVNKQVIADNKSFISSLEELKNKLKNGSISVKEYKEQLAQLKTHYSELGVAADKTVGGVDNMIKVIADKARWLAAFYLITQTIEAFKQATATIKETEDAVVELQRVLNIDVSKSALSSGLYDIAKEYGRTFDEVQEVAVKFAQTGMEWDDVLTSTRNTMLALNTAELDVTQSTEGLIAIISQWNLSANEMGQVIDKINITADNFTVTSEKLVAALQRASGTAKNANLSLEETIGIITALSTATGRSGENIGTALNSLIAYTKKESSLKVFAGLSEEMDRTVQKFNAGAISIYDLWKNLSKELNALSKEQQTYLLQSITQDTEYSDFAAELESQATDVTQRIQEVYRTAGTFRQNYFIALLNEITTADEAILNMSDSSGYSMKENVKYMETWTAQLNQLKTIAAELAVQLGEDGLMELLKFLTQLSIGTLQLTKNLGGIAPILALILSIFVQMKAIKISESINGFRANILKVITSLQGFAQMLLTVEGRRQIVQTIFSGGLVSIFGAFTTAVSAATMAVSYFNNKVEEARQKAIENSNAYKEQAESLNNLKNSYLQAIENLTDEQIKSADLSAIKTELIRQYGIEKEAVDKLNESRAVGLELFDKERKQKITSAYYEIADDYEKAYKAMTNLDQYLNISMSTGYLTPSQQAKDILSTYGISAEAPTTKDSAFKLSVDKNIQDISQLKIVLQEVSLALEQNGEQTKWLDDIIKDIDKTTEKWNETYGQMGTVADYIINAMPGANNEIEKLRDNISDVESYKEFEKAVLSAGEEMGVFEDVLLDILYNTYPEFIEKTNEAGESTKAFEDSATYLESLSKELESLTELIDNYQSGLDTVYSAIDEFNEQQSLSIDTIQDLLSKGWEYIQMLNVTSDGLSINEQYANLLKQAQIENAYSAIENAKATAILETAQKYLALSAQNVGDETSKLPAKFDIANASLSELTQGFINATITADQFTAALSGQGLNENYAQDFKNEINDIITTFDGLKSSISLDTGDWSNSAKKAAQSVASAQKEYLEQQKEAVKERYDAEINALKEVQEENKRLQEQEEYYRNRQEILDNIEKAKTRSGVEYREQESEARKKLEELDREWQEKIADWSIEDKISELEALRDAEIVAIEAQIDRIGNSTSYIATKTVNANTKANQEMLNNYNEQYLQPIEESTIVVYDEMFGELSKGFSGAADNMLEIAKLNSMQLYNIYNNNFISKIKNDLLSIQKQMIGLGGLTLFDRYPMRTIKDGSLSPNVYNSNSSVSNNNVYANVYGANAARAFTSGIFKKP